MKSRLGWRWVWLWLLGALVASPAQAGSHTRYALVVGNDYGRAPELSLPNLRHAESEARRLRQQLIEWGGFHPDRVVLLNGSGRVEVLAAAARLAEQFRRDRLELGPMPTLFAFFFTGHGLAGRLLTADEPLTGSDLAAIFGQMQASLTVGFIDACFSGSLDLEALRAKGVLPTPGFNPITELPAELLASEGTLWFVSSRPEELSYEDEQLGGLFTHYFIEAFSQAPGDAIGVTLDDMWEHARRRTRARAALFGRSQTPEKFVRRLKAQGPVYFSFSRERRARLLFDPEVEGTFVLQYEHGALVEKVVKTAGRSLEVAVYEGRLWLGQVEGAEPERYPSRQFEVRRGDAIRIRPRGQEPAGEGPGYREVPIRSKGQLTGLELSQTVPGAWFLLGVDYRFNLVDPRLVGAGHGLVLGGYLAHGPLSASLDLSWARRASARETWSVEMDEFGLGLGAGYGFALGGTRLDLEARGSLWIDRVRYASGAWRTPLGCFLGGGLRFWLPLPLDGPWVVLQARVALGARLAEGLTLADRAHHWAFEPSFQLGLLLPLGGG
jgi:hypothetical protein